MADAYEQLGYQMEGPQWRGIFLSAALELRNGVDLSTDQGTSSYDTVLSMPVPLLFDFAAVHIIGERAADVDIRINFSFTGTGTGTGEQWTMWVRNGVLNARPKHAPNADLSVSGDRVAITMLLLVPGQATTLIAAGALTVDGDTGVLDTYAAITDKFDRGFNMVTP